MNDKNDKVNDRRWLVLLVLVWLAACVWLVYQKWALIRGLALPDTDDNMRLQQVRDWLGGQAWFDLRQHRMGGPEGADIHWSRLVDLPLAGLILFFKTFTSTAFAERAAVTIAPLLPLGVAMLVLALIVRRLVDRQAWLFAPMLLVFAPTALGMMTPLRIDHHGWQLALLMAMVLGVVSGDRVRGGLLSGVALGLSLAIGIELLPYLGLTAALIALLWVADRDEAPRIAAFGAAAAGTVALSLLVFVPPASRLLGMCDALSIVHVQALALGGAGLFLLALLPLGNRWARLAAMVVVGAVVAGFTWKVHPQCLGDPSALIDPDARRLWLANVREARPIYRQSMVVQIGTLSLPSLGLIGLGIALWRYRYDRRRLTGWLVIGVLAVFGFAFCFFQTRAGSAAQILGVAGAAMLAWVMFLWVETIGNRPLRLIAIAGSIYLLSGLGFVQAGNLLAAKPSPTVRKARTANASCSTLTALRPLDALPPGRMFTLVDLGPRLIVGTHHSAIIGPYHRNGVAIADVMKAFGGTADEAYAIVNRWHADYVLICPDVGEATIYARRAPKGFYAELAKGHAPGWLDPVRLTGTTPYRLWRVKSFPAPRR